jgi:polyhydroxyalkanoate synthase
MSESELWTLPPGAPDPKALANAWSRVVQSALDAAQAGLKPRTSSAFDPAAPARAFGEFTLQMWTDPVGVLRAAQEASGEWMDLWSRAARTAAGGTVEPLIAPERGDRRFRDPAWSEQPVFDYLKQAYLLASRQANALIEKAEGVDEPTRTSAAFYAQS